ncbi:methionine gamma-lyase [Paratrimastix pyriformis]|uniref:Methionine gamma-lyase n=1 Tax=Paratrimastix pyriformis TaxID=342808 RepID=A0ABQ8UIF7_9EUKA|nr:methionine gamma-lyase [Paratrimastix pyriformis]
MAEHAMTEHAPGTSSFETRCLHADGHEKPMNSHVWPIFQTSTFMFDSPDHGADLFAGRAEGHIYSRIGNPTVQAFERLMANLDEGVGSVGFSSGMAAVTGCLMPFLRAGDSVVLGDTMYGPSISLAQKYLTRWGITVLIVDSGNLSEIDRVLHTSPPPKLLYLESPANPTNKITDIAAVSAKAHEVGALVAVDATFATPFFQRPLALGADLSLHSLTKVSCSSQHSPPPHLAHPHSPTTSLQYIAGHGDVIGGVVTCAKEEHVNTVRTWRKDTGGILSPLDAFLVMRGIRTLPVRMEQLNKNAIAVARFLRSHPAVEQVLHPVFDDFPNHQVAVRQMSGFGSTFSFTMKAGYDAAKALLENVHLAVVAVSLGGVDTLIEHPASMTHCGVPLDLMRQQGLTPSLIRISVGLENPDEIIADLAQAIEAATAAFPVKI